MSDKPLHDKTAWISGASRGIGRAIAVSLARAGATVIAGARDVEALRQLQTVLGASGGIVHGVALDVSSLESVDAFAAQAMELAGPPSILVNNAGSGLFKDMTEMTPADFDRQIDVDLKGPWYLSRAAVPHMKKFGEGRIVNIGSVAGLHAFKRGTAYCAAKAGLDAMSEAMMLELREFGIHVTLIAPGSVHTAFHQQALPAAHHGDQSWMLTPEDIAAACLHVLTSPPAALISRYEIRPLKPVK